MKEEIIRKIAVDRGILPIEKELFVKFIQKRFPNESDFITSYVSEWADRFLSGNPVIYMDKLSLAIYTKLLIQIK